MYLTKSEPSYRVEWSSNISDLRLCSFFCFLARMTYCFFRSASSFSRCSEFASRLIGASSSGVFDRTGWLSLYAASVNCSSCSTMVLLLCVNLAMTRLSTKRALRFEVANLLFL